MLHPLHVLIAVIWPRWRPANADLRECLEIGYDAAVIRLRVRKSAKLAAFALTPDILL